MRQLVAVVAGVAAAVAGALIAGEYPFTGAVPAIVGILVGLAVAEIVVAIARRATIVLGTVCAVIAGSGVAYAMWDDAGYGIRPIAPIAWAGVAVAFVTAGLRAGWWVRGVGFRLTAGSGERPERSGVGSGEDGAVTDGRDDRPERS